MKLLVVEDDEDTSSFIKYVLEGEGYAVETASSVSEARERLKAFSPELVILDRGLPDRDGLDFCRELRAMPEGRGVAVLFLSAAKSPNDVLDGFSAGGDDYMPKPFGFLELIARVQALLRRGGEPGSAPVTAHA